MIYIEKFLESLEKDEMISSRTIEFYKKDLKDFKIFLGDKDILDVDEYDIQEYVISLKNKYADNSIIRKITSLKAFYKYLIKKEYLNVSPVKEISTTRKYIKSGEEIKWSEVKAILDICGDSEKEKKDKLIIKLLAETGLKIIDILNLTIKELEKNDYKYFSLKRNGEYVIIELSSELSKEIKDYKENLKICYNDSEDKLFQGVTNQIFKDRFIKYGKKAKLDRIVFPSMIRNKCISEKKEEFLAIDDKEILERTREEYFRIGIGDDI